jgi:hypothetical protein
MFNNKMTTPKPNALQLAANELDRAVSKYIETAAELRSDPTAVAWSLPDSFGSFRFILAQRAAFALNMREAKAQNGR